MRGDPGAEPRPAGGIIYIPAGLGTPRDPQREVGGCSWENVFFGYSAQSSSAAMSQKWMVEWLNRWMAYVYVNVYIL